MTDDSEILVRLMDELTGKIAPCELILKPDSVFHLVGLLQLALRHPDVSPSSRRMANTVIAAARQYFADCPAILDVITRGYDPAEDRQRPSITSR